MKASVPALLMLGLGWAIRHQSLPRPLTNEIATTQNDASATLLRDAVLLQSQTFVVPPISSASALWHAELQSARGVSGRAMLSGQITRVWAKVGQNVETGDRILRIAGTSPALSDAPLPESSRSRRAENAQVEASRAQNSLQQKMDRAQAQLGEAQQRIARAKVRIAQTTDIVRRLQAGIGASETDAAPTENTANSNADAQRAAAQARDAAQREAQNAERLAESAERRAAAANRVLDDAQANARTSSQRARKLKETRERELVANENAASDEPLARSTTNEVQPKSTPRVPKKITSQSVVDEAESTSREAAKSVSGAQEKARAASDEAAKLRASAKAARDRATSSLHQLQIFGDDAPKTSSPKTTARETKTPSDLPSVSDAVRMVRAATEESADAQREATRLKAQVESYAAQARETGQQLVQSSSELGSVEQRSLDQTLQTNLAVVRAPSSGTVVWVASVSDNVSAGDAVVRMGKGGALQARFADYSGLWKTLQAETILPAIVSDSAKRPDNFAPPSSTRLSSNANSTNANATSANATSANATSANANATNSISTNVNAKNASATNAANLDSANANATSANANAKNANAKNANASSASADSASAKLSTNDNVANDSARDEETIAATARIESVTPPERAGEPAIVSVSVAPIRDENAATTGAKTRRARRLRAGMTIWCALDASGKRPILQVPQSAIFHAPQSATSTNANATNANATNAATFSANATNPTAPISDESSTRNAISSSSADVQNAISSNVDATSATATNANVQNAVSPNVVSPNAISPNAVSRDATTTNAISPNAISPNATAVKPEDSNAMIAVLKPVADAVSPNQAATNADFQRIEWRRVALGSSQNGTQQIVGGLLPGERVALNPAALWNYSQQHGAQATIRLNRAG